MLAIGLSEGEDLDMNGPADESDDDVATETHDHLPFEPYALMALLPFRCAVIQATQDNFLAAARARTLFGSDTGKRRLYAVDARNHRFSGGKDAFDRSLIDALGWITSAASSSSGRRFGGRLGSSMAVAAVESQRQQPGEVMMRSNTATLLCLGVCMAMIVAVEAAAQTTDTIALRGHTQTLRLTAQRGGHPVIVSSGDGGWIHLGPQAAEGTAAKGYFVVGFDVKAYLESFTSGQSSLQPDDEPGDYKVLADYAARGVGPSDPS